MGESSGERGGEARFQRLIRDLHVGVLVQGPHLEIRVSNQAARELLGLTEDQLHGRTSYDPKWNIVLEDGTPFPPERRPATIVLLSGRAVRNVVMGIDRPVRRDRVWLLVDVEPEFGPNGEVVEVVSTLTDISERKRLESSLLRAQRLESIGRLAGGIAHDFNNLLTAILSYTRMVHDDLPVGSPGRADLEQALGAADRAASLTRQLLTFASRQVTMPKVVRLSDALAGLEKLLSKLIGEHVDLVVSAEPDCWDTVIDPAQLEQVLVNLAVNARDAMPAGGRLTIHASNVPAGSREEVPSGDMVLIRVIDTGRGMDAETRQHVFDPFFTTKETGQGTGLGLAIVHGVVERHGGRVTVQSAPGQGTEFDVYLPRAAGAPVAEPPARASGPPRGYERILLVEDEGPVRALAKRILEHQGYTVLTATNGAEAYDLVQSAPEPIALVITDVVMPKLDGRALAARLKATSPETRVLLVSGYMADQAPIDEPFLSKPYTPDALARKVREVLDSLAGGGDSPPKVTSRT